MNYPHHQHDDTAPARPRGNRAADRVVTGGTVYRRGEVPPVDADVPCRRLRTARRVAAVAGSVGLALVIVLLWLPRSAAGWLVLGGVVVAVVVAVAALGVAAGTGQRANPQGWPTPRA